MLNASQTEKIKLEHDAAKLFLRLYEKQNAVSMRHIWYNQPKKPDVSCYQNKQKLDIEIAHVYGSEKEAMAILGRDLSTETQDELKKLLFIPAKTRLTQALQRILKQKAKKHYDSERVWLVIRNANPFWQNQDIQSVKHILSIPNYHPFEEIWVIGDIEGKSGLTKLYP